MLKIYFSILLSFMAVMISSCAGNRSRVNAYTDPSFDLTTIKSIAILPMRNAQISYGDAMMINRSIQQAVYKARPDLNIVSSEDAVRGINDAGLADDYSNFLSSYYTSGIPNQNVLLKLGKALKVDAIMQGGIINVYQRDGDGWSQKGGANVTIKYGVIGTGSGVIIWDASGECQSWTASEYEQAPSIMDTVGPAINKIFTGFPLAKLDSVLPKYKETINTEGGNDRRGGKGL